MTLDHEILKAISSSNFPYAIIFWPYLPTRVDWVVAGQQRRPRGGAHGLHVGILQNDSTPRQPFHVGSEDFAVVPRDIVEACQSDVKF